jgi:hypothetical protein
MRSWTIPSLAITLVAYSAQSADLQPPKMAMRSQAQEAQVSACYSRFARNTGQMGRVIVRVTIAPDGSVAEAGFPPGIAAWQEQTARCVLQVVPFTPGTKDGTPVTAQVDMPIVFSLDDSGRVTFLKVKSTDEEMEAALRDCYPADTISIATPKFRVAVSPRGRAMDVKLVESSGDENLDRAGACVLKALNFHPTKQGNEPVSSSAIIPVTVRPPKRAASTAPQP